MSEITNAKRLFRENALNELNQLPTLDTALSIVPASSVTYFIAALMALSGLLIWSIWGVMETEVYVQGVIMNAGEINAVENRYQTYRNEQARTMQTFKYLMEKKQDLYIKHYVTLDDVQRARQAYLQAEENMSSVPQLNARSGQQLFPVCEREKDGQCSSYQPEQVAGLNEAPALLALVFVSHQQGKQIQAGMQAYLLPSYLSYFEYGYMKGIVQQVSLYPISREAAYAYLGNMNLVDEYFAGGAPFAIKIKFAYKASSSREISWTSSHPVPVAVNAGLGVTGKVITKTYHPYQLLLRLTR